MTDYQPHDHDPANDPNYARPCCLAAVLRHVADRLDTVDERHRMSLHLSFQPDSDSDEVLTAAVDAVGMAIHGRPGEPEKMSSGGYHYKVDGQFERMAAAVTAFGSVTSPEDRAAKEEVERLRAEVEELRRQREELHPTSADPMDTP